MVSLGFALPSEKGQRITVSHAVGSAMPRCNPDITLGWYKSLMLSQEDHKWAVKHVCASSQAIWASAVRCTSLLKDLQISWDWHSGVGREGIGWSWEWAGGGTQIWKLCHIQTSIPGHLEALSRPIGTVLAIPWEKRKSSSFPWYCSSSSDPCAWYSTGKPASSSAS